MFDKVLKYFGLTKKSLSSAESISILKAGGDRTDIEYYEGWVYACVNKIAKGFAQVEWDLFQVKGKQVLELEEHPILSLINKFNPRFTRYDSLELMAIYYTLYGRCPLYMVIPEGKTTPTELWVMPPQHLTPATIDSEGYALTYRYTMGMKSLVIDASRVLDIRNPDPSNPAHAFGIINPIRTVADTDYYAKNWNKNLLLNQAQPSGIVTVDGNLEDKEARQLRAMLEETYSGFENAHRLMILKNGAKMTPFSLSPTDMDFSTLRNMNRDEICALFGVPKILLGLEGSYNRATAETAEMVFAKYTLQPMMSKIIEQFNEFFVPLFGTGLWLDFDFIIPEDKEFELKEKEIGWNKWLTTNEIRREEGRPELTGGDVIYGSVVSVPLVGVGGEKKDAQHSGFEMKLENPNTGVSLKTKMKILKKVTARDYKITQYGKNIADIFEKKVNKLNIENKVLKISMSAGLKKKSLRQITLTADQKLDWWYKTIESKRKVEGQWKAKMNGLFARQKAKILANIENSDAFKGLNNKSAKQVTDELMFDYDEEVKTTISIIKPEYYNSLMAGAGLASDLIGEAPISILSIPKCVEWLNYVADKYGEGMVETTRTEVSRLFETALAEGQSNYEIQQQVSTYFDEIATYRAEMIARTESARSLTASQGFVWEEYGFKKVEWYAEPTACATCQGLAMDTWKVEDAQSGTIEYSHPNCECRFLPVE